jgi:hypothetical protein
MNGVVVTADSYHLDGVFDVENLTGGSIPSSRVDGDDIFLADFCIHSRANYLEHV